MPVHQCHTVRQGTIGHSVFLLARTTEGEPAVALSFESARAAYVRTDGPAVETPIHAGAAAERSAGSIVEVDSSLLPGVYRFEVPDEVLAAGAAEALMAFSIPGAVVEPIRFNLVAYDPQDAWSLGMTQLQDYKRHQVLRRALPRFTEMELALGENNEKLLVERLGEQPPEWANEEGI